MFFWCIFGFVLQIATRMNEVRIEDIATVQFGLYAKPKDAGSAKYLQAKHFDDDGVLLERVDTFLDIDAKNEKHLLIDGDVLFVGKGFRNFASVYRKEMGAAIASSIFFVLRLDPSKVYPEFLVTLINSGAYQSLFQSMGAGSKITSIRKSELGAVSLMLPALELQKKIAHLRSLHLQDLHLNKQLINLKELRFQSVVQQLINQ